MHEKNENIVRWVLRALTAIGIGVSVVTFDWYVALTISITLVVLDWFLERTLFYYSTMHVGNMMLDYDPDQWVGTVVISIGEPSNPRSRKIFGIWLKTQDYAEKFFELLNSWTCTEDNTQGDLKITFIVDEDTYYVFMYCDPMRESVKKQSENIKKRNELKKYGKEHVQLIMHQVLCKGFSTTNGYALGMFLENNPPGNAYWLAPYITGPDGKHIEADNIKPIFMTDYKFKLPHELTEDDFEYYHWHKIIERRSIGQDA